MSNNNNNMQCLGVFFLFTFLSNAAMSSPISVGDIVTVGNKEWAQTDLFTSLSWNDMNAVCPSGVCVSGGTLNGHDVFGWTWASQSDVLGLFTTFTGSIANPYFETNSSWAPTFMSSPNFRPTDTTFTALFTGVTGLTSTASGTSLGIAGKLDDATHPLSLDSARVDLGTGNSIFSAQIGGWFYRQVEATVPEPTTLALLGLGLFGLGFNKRRHVQV